MRQLTLLRSARWSLQMTSTRLCTSLVLAAHLMQLLTIAAGCGRTVNDASFTKFARIGRCDVAYGCRGACVAQESNACVVQQVSPCATLCVRGMYSRTRTAADVSNNDDATCAPRESLQISVTKPHEVLLGGSPTSALYAEPARLRRARQRRRHACPGPHTFEGHSLFDVWAGISVVFGCGLLIAGKHFSGPVCLALSLNYWFAATWIVCSISLHIGSALLGLAGVLRRSLWLFGNKGNRVLSPFCPKPALPSLSLVFCIVRRPAMHPRKRTDRLASILTRAPIAARCEKAEDITKSLRIWTSIVIQGQTHKRLSHGVCRMTHACKFSYLCDCIPIMRPPHAQSISRPLPRSEQTIVPLLFPHLDSSMTRVYCSVASQVAPSDAAAAAVRPTSTRNDKRRAGKDNSPSVRFCAP